jgi:hypothetical protein
VCLSVSGNSTEAGTTVFLNAASKNIHQSFAPYFDSVIHPDYEEADMWSRDYREANREAMARQQVEVGVHDVMASDKTTTAAPATFDLTGRRVHGTLRRGIFVVNGKKVLMK